MTNVSDLFTITLNAFSVTGGTCVLSYLLTQIISAAKVTRYRTDQQMR